MQIGIDFLCQMRSRIRRSSLASLMERSTAAIELTRWAGAVVTAPRRTKKDIETDSQDRHRERDKETNKERQTTSIHKRNIQSHMEREKRQMQKVTFWDRQIIERWRRRHSEIKTMLPPLSLIQATKWKWKHNLRGVRETLRQRLRIHYKPNFDWRKLCLTKRTVKASFRPSIVHRER